MSIFRFYGNHYDPRKPDLKESMNEQRLSESRKRIIKGREAYLCSMLIGEPQATTPVEDGGYTVKSLKNMDYVGLYGVELDDIARQNPQCVKEYDGWLQQWIKGIGWVG